MIEVNGYNYTVGINNGVASLNVTLPIGKYQARAYFLGDDKYNATTSDLSSEFTVADKEIVTIIITAPESVEVDNNLVFTVTNSTPVNVTVNGVKVELKDGKYTYNVTEAGIATIVVTSEETEDLYAGFNSTTVNVLKHNSTVSIDPVINHFVGDDFTITVHNNTAVVLKVNGKEYSVVDGKVVIDTTKLPAGEYIVTAYVVENDKYLANSSTIKFNITKRNSSINITVNEKYEIETDFTIGIENSTAVNVTVNGIVCPVVDGKVVIDTTALAAGNYTVTATIYESDKYIGNTTSKTFTIFKHNAVIDSVVVPAADTTVGRDVTVTVTMTTVTSGKVVALPVGEYTAHAYYLGDDKYNATYLASATGFKVVAKQNATVIINAADVVEIEGKLVFTVNNSTPVVVTINDVVYTPDANGNYTFNADVAGVYTIVARSNETDDYYAGFNSTVFEVVKHASSINVTGDEIKVGENATINIEAPNYNGAAIVNINGVNHYVVITNGAGQLNVTGLTEDTYDVKVTYLENDKYLGTTNNSAKVIVTKVASADVNATVENITAGEPAVVKVTVPEDATGNVTVKIGNITKTVPVSGGENEIIILDVPQGEHNVTVTYNGDDKYDPVTVTDKITVAPQPPKEGVNVDDLGNGTIVVNVPDNATGNVTIKIGDHTYNATVENGTARIDLVGEAPGTYNATVIYTDSNGLNLTSTKLVHIPKYDTPITIEVTNSVVGDVTTITVTVPENITGIVTIEIDGKKYNMAATAGQAVFDIEGLTAGVKTVVATYAGDDSYLSNGTTKQFNVTKRASSVNVTTSPISVGETATIDIVGPAGFNGTAVVKVAGVEYYVPLENGVGQLNVTGLKEGNYDVNVTYLENDKYLSSVNGTAKIVVSKVASEVTVKFDNITAGEIAVLNITVTDGATGNVTVKVGEDTYTVGLVSGKAQLIVPNLKVGEYDITATYNGDDRYESDVATAKLNVGKAKLSPDDVVVEDLGNGTVKVTVPENATGNVTVKVGDNTYVVNITNGTAYINLGNETPGAHEVSVIYSGDGNYSNITVTKVVTIPKNPTPIIIEVNNTVVGNVTRIVVTVPEDVTDIVTIEIDGKKYNKTAVDGKAVFEIEGLTAGVKTVVATYAGDDSYLSNGTTEQFNVTKRASSVNVTGAEIKVGEDAIINIAGPSGYDGIALVDIAGVKYFVNLTGGAGQLSVSGLTNGTHDVKVTYIENDRYLSSTNNSAKVIVTKVAGADVDVTVGNITEGEPAIVKVTVPEDATGNVTVTIGNITKTYPVSGGENEIPIFDVPKGEHNVTVTYNGDDKYDPVTVTDKINVAPQPPKEGVNIDELGNGTIIVAVPDNATGNVTVQIGNHTYNATVENGTARIDLVGELPGTYNATVTFINQDGLNVTTTKLIHVPKYATPMSIEVRDAKVGDVVNVVVKVDGNVTGNITIEINGANYTSKIEGGKATFKVENLNAGNKTIIATYAGNDYYEFNSTTEQFKVFKNNAPMSVSAEVNGAEVTITVSDLPSDVTGYVIVTVNGTEYGINITKTKSVTFTVSQSGKFDVNATYLGDDKYLSNASSTSFEAQKIDGDVSIDVGNTVAGNDVIVKVTVPEDAKGNVTVKIGNTTKVVDVTGGENTIAIPGIGEGTHDVEVVYSGDDKYDSKTVTKTITVFKSINNDEQMSRGWDSPYDYQAEFLDKEGNVLKNTDVQFIVNGKTYTVKTDDQGIGYLTNSHLPVGSYNITVVNPVTGEQRTAKVTIVKRLIENKDITMDFMDGTYYVVRAIGDDGNPVGEGEFVDVLANTIHYSVRTDKDGYARLKINLNPKTYTITAEYKNTKVSNKLVVKQTLKLVKKTVKVKKGKKLVLKAQLKWTNGKPIKGKKIVFKFKGKKYNAKTNSKGIAKVTIKKKVTKKLKKGKKYSYSASYYKNSVKGKVKVKK